MTDPREQPLNDVCRLIMIRSNYDPHFSGIEERLIMETKLFLARLDALMDFDRIPQRITDAFRQIRENIPIRTVTFEPNPVPMILFCHSCGVQHIDAEEPHKPDCAVVLAPEGMAVPCTCDRWMNPPHRSHLCAYCGYVWRPADVPTTGVKEIMTTGSSDSSVVRGVIDKTARFRPQWRHKVRGTIYMELARGHLQLSASDLGEGTLMVIYQGEDNRVWVRNAAEFEDGRFEKL